MQKLLGFSRGRDATILESDPENATKSQKRHPRQSQGASAPVDPFPWERSQVFCLIHDCLKLQILNKQQKMFQHIVNSAENSSTWKNKINDKVVNYPMQIKTLCYETNPQPIDVICLIMSSNLEKPQSPDQLCYSNRSPKWGIYALNL